jgi:signal transduction histidine kinase
VVYRVAQEALTNVARNARATTVELTLTRQGHAVALRVSDDGIGMQNRGMEPVFAACKNGPYWSVGI